MPAFKIRKTSAIFALLIAAYMSAGFLPFACILVSLFLYLLATRPISISALRAAGVPALFSVFLIASVPTFMPTAFTSSAWNVAKDTYFFVAPVIMLFSGLVFLRTDTDFTRIVLAAIYVLTLLSIIIYSDFLFGGGLTGFSLETRYLFGLDSSASTLALLLILTLHPTLSALLRNTSHFSLLILNLFLIIASLSRVDLAITLTSLVYVYSHSKLLRTLTIAIVIFLAAAPLLQISLPQTTYLQTDGAGFLDKLLGSLDEFRISDYSSLSEMNENWRGYEAYLGVQLVTQVGGIAHFTGLGYGSFVSGPFEDKLQVIPFFHNGFVTIYLKAGLLGVFAFLLFIFRLYRLGLTASRDGYHTGDPRIARASIMILLLTNAVMLQTLAVHGVYYSKTTLELFFIGLAVYSLHHARRDAGLSS